MPTDPLYLLGMLCLIVVASEWLVRRTFLKHIGTALLVILVTALAANVGLLPAGSTAKAPVPVYDGIFAYVAPLAIFWLLLPVNLRDVLKAGLPMIGLFLLGSLGTAAGVLVAMWLLDGAEAIGPLFNAVGGMFTATYTGGSVNFNTIALQYDVIRDGVLYGGSIVVDNIITTVWMVATLAVPRLLTPIWRRKNAVAEAVAMRGEIILGIEEDTETLHPIDLGLVLMLGLFAVWLSDRLAEWLAPIPSALILTVIALVLAQIPAVGRLKGVRVLGMFAVYLFLAVIGAFCDVAALRELEHLGVMLLLFATLAVGIHGLLTFGAAWLLKIDPDIAAVASQANVGGGTSALALARSLGREDLVLPGVLVGSLGYAVGTFLGFWVANVLG
ncbi:DUF819 family protein [Rhodocaloribacter sp.]